MLALPLIVIFLANYPMHQRFFFSQTVKQASDLFYCIFLVFITSITSENYINLSTWRKKNMMSPFLFKGWVISSSMVTCCHRFNKDRGRSTALVYSRLYLFNLSNTVSIDYEFDRSIECLLGPCHLLETQIPSSSMEEGSSKTKCWWWGWPMPDTSRRQRVDCLHAPSLLPRCPSSGNLQVFS